MAGPTCCAESAVLTLTSIYYIVEQGRWELPIINTPPIQVFSSFNHGHSFAFLCFSLIGGATRDGRLLEESPARVPFLFLFLPPATCQTRAVPLNSSPLRNRTPLSPNVCVVWCGFTTEAER